MAGLGGFLSEADHDGVEVDDGLHLVDDAGGRPHHQAFRAALADDGLVVLSQGGGIWQVLGRHCAQRSGLGGQPVLELRQAFPVMPCRLCPVCGCHDIERRKVQPVHLPPGQA